MVTVNELRKKAKTMGILNLKQNKEELIHAIQATEGNFPCFRTANGYCDQSNCLWHDECISNK